jgi:23S rRNA G2445 N2-methylase RlmL
MKEPEIKIKLSYISGLKPVVLDELRLNNLQILQEAGDAVYVSFTETVLPKIKQLRSVARAYVVLHSAKYHPTHIAKHKAILGELVDIVLENNKKQFTSFNIRCAGADSKEVRAIATYIQDTFVLEEREEADLKIHFIKPEEMWEMGIQITPRPLSVREYKVAHMSGAMDPTIAYAVNSLANLETAKSYLNIFSGSATLLIEAGQCFPRIAKLIGFDNDKKHLSLSIQNIKKAGLIAKIQVKEADIFDYPDFGQFDVIVADLPFGMAIAKSGDLEKLYKKFVTYCEDKLLPGGRLVIYTSEYEPIEPILQTSSLKIVHSLQLKFITNANANLKTKIIVCEFK